MENNFEFEENSTKEKKFSDKKPKLYGKVILVASSYIIISSEGRNFWRMKTDKDIDIKVGDKTHIQ